MKRKRTVRLVAPPVRNPLVLLAVQGMQRKGGTHEKCDKAKRRAEKVELLKRGLNSVGQSSWLLTSESLVRIQ